MRTVEVHHELTGASDLPVLVLAGALGTTLEIWDPLVGALSERFRVLRYDHWGHGRSPVPGGPSRSWIWPSMRRRCWTAHTAQYEDHGPWVERAALVRWVETAGIAAEVVAG